ncbi:hypothetical protein [Hyalangium versicolor]|uniref:hypothetical protein n=1 Tax=Hyalangium versicolor TaxID=2861190 RepID=UPI001CCED3CB|nr:hypothetical protein [Hyalangium versicolor]
MPRPRLGRLAALVLGVSLGLLGTGCEPIDPIDIPVGLSDKTCYRDSDCAPNGCCGEGTHPTHVSEAPDCSNVRCDGTCQANSIDCGRCVPYCRDSRCEAACQ